MDKTKKIGFFDAKIKMHIVIVAILFAVTLMTGVLSKTLVCAGVAACLVMLFFCDRLYLAFPFVIFYNSFYGLGLGVSILRIFSMLVILNFILRLKRNSRLRATRAAPLFVYVLFILFVFVPKGGISLAASVGLDIIACFIVVSNLSQTKRLKNFFRVYIFVCLASFVSGWLVGNQVGNEFTYYRFMATFEDPNYMGFFFTVAIFSLLVLKLFDKRIRYLLVAVLYAMMVTSLSMTAILVNLILWIVYCVLLARGKKIHWNFKIFLAFVGAVLLLIALIVFGAKNPEIPVLGDVSYRINNVIKDVLAGDFSSATTGRSTLAKEHLLYFFSLPFLRFLFGGISVNARYIHPSLSLAAHNEYVDLLLNVGIVGTCVMLGNFLLTLGQHWKKYQKTKEDEHLFLLIGKIVWMFYAMTLTMFLDYRFMLFFLI